MLKRILSVAAVAAFVVGGLTACKKEETTGDKVNEAVKSGEKAAEGAKTDAEKAAEGLKK